MHVYNKIKYTLLIFQILPILGLHEKRVQQDDVQYLVEWEGYKTFTWEVSTNIPKFIRDYFEQTKKNNIPKPRVKRTKTVGSKTYYLLTWDGDDTCEDQFVPAADFYIDSDQEVDSVCNTRKHHGARFCRTTAGIFIGTEGDWLAYVVNRSPQNLSITCQANPSNDYFQTSHVALPRVIYSPYISRFCGDRLTTKLLQSPAV
jgi:hypothetical protein